MGRVMPTVDRRRLGKAQLRPFSVEAMHSGAAPPAWGPVPPAAGRARCAAETSPAFVVARCGASGVPRFGRVHPRPREAG